MASPIFAFLISPFKKAMSATKFWEMIFNSSLLLNLIQSRLWKQPLKILFKIVAALKHATWQHLEFRYLNPLLCAPLEMCGSNLDCKFGSYIIGQLSLPPPTSTWNPLGWGNEVLKQEFPWSYLSFEFTLNWCISTTFCCVVRLIHPYLENGRHNCF